MTARNGKLELTAYREQIDEIDDQLLVLLKKRAEISKRVGAVKAETGVEPVYAPHREKEVIERLKAQNAGELPDTAITALWTEIFSASRALQKPERVAFLGPEGSFGNLAARAHFGEAPELIPVRPQVDIFSEVEEARADYGIVAIENSVQGIVRDVLERFLHTPLKVCAETYQPIKHHLLSQAELADIQRVYSHPQPFAQCQRWLNENISGAEQVEVASTSEAAKLAAAEPTAAAIASELASKTYQVPIIAHGIMDEPDNTTRFFIIGKHSAAPSGRDRTSFFFAIKDKVGALHEALEIFKEARLNLSYIESLASRKKAWDYVFFAEVVGHKDNGAERVGTALARLEALCPEVRIIGSYPRGTRAC